jgi:predicted ATPase
MHDGLFIMDEPEAALSPQRQLSLLTRMSQLVDSGKTQFIIATHSPILMTFPDAEIVTLDKLPPSRIGLQETSHYQITRGILESPERYWKHLADDAPSDD